MRVATAAAMLVGGLLTSCGGDSPMDPGGGTPRIALSAAQISFVGVAGGANPAGLTTTITNAGSGTLTSLVVGTITYGLGGSGWLTASLNLTRAPTTLTLTPSVVGVASGLYNAGVPIMSAGAENSPQVVNVSLLVLDQGSATTLAAAGESAVFLDSPGFATRLTLQPGGEYLIAVVNTAAASSVSEDFTLAGASRCSAVSPTAT